jgi:hypothetical protein
MSDATEYGIAFAHSPHIVHRGPMTLEEARLWVDEWIDMGAKPEAIVIIERDVSSWRRLDP